MKLRSDLLVVQNPVVWPYMNGATGKNTVVTDPNFGMSIVRATDRTTATAKKSCQTADAAQAVIWNRNDTLLGVRDTDAKTYLLQFIQKSMSVEQLSYTYMGSIAFSKASPAILYVLNGTVVSKVTFSQPASGYWSYVTEDVLCDFADILPKGFVPKSNSAFVQSQGDQVFSVGFSEGDQNTGTLVCLWKRGNGKNGFRMLNTETGEVTGGWGELGIAKLTSTKNVIPFPWHEVYGTENPAYTMITPATGTDSQIVWDNATLNLIDNEMTGHEAHGYTNFYAGGPGGGQLAYAPYTAPLSKSMLLPSSALPSSQGQAYIGDRHWQFGKVVDNDESVIWSSGSGIIPPAPFVSAWQNEVTGYDTVAKVVYRACHTMSSGLSKEFIVANCIAVPGQTGRYVAFTSDWFQTLGGNNNGQPAGDVFIVAV